MRAESATLSSELEPLKNMFPLKFMSVSYICVRELKEVNVTPGSSAAEAETQISAWQVAQQAAQTLKQPMDEALPESSDSD